MDAQRKAEIGDTVHHPLVKVDHELALLRRFAAGQLLDERLLVGHGGVSRVLDQPVDQTHPILDLRYEAERQQNLGPVVGTPRELGEEPHNCVGVQQLGHAERRTLIALEIEPTVFTVPGRDQDHAPVVHQLVINRQRVGRCDAGALTVVHGARYADENDPLETGSAQVGQPVTQGLLIHEGGDLGAQSLHPGQLRFDQRPELQHVQLRLHLDGPVVVLRDHPGNHQVPDPALDAGLSGELQYLARVLRRLLRTALHVRRHELERDGVKRQPAAPHRTSGSGASPYRSACLAVSTGIGAGPNSIDSTRRNNPRLPENSAPAH